MPVFNADNDKTPIFYKEGLPLCALLGFEGGANRFVRAMGAIRPYRNFMRGAAGLLVVVVAISHLAMDSLNAVLFLAFKFLFHLFYPLFF